MRGGSEENALSLVGGKTWWSEEGSERQTDRQTDRDGDRDRECV